MDTLNEDPNLTYLNIDSSELNRIASLSHSSKKSVSIDCQDFDILGCFRISTAKSSIRTMFYTSPFQWLKGIALLLLMLTFMGYCPSSAAAQLTLAWNPVPDVDLVDYRLYARISGQTYGGEPLWVGAATSATIVGLKQNTSYCFVVRATNSSGMESDNSNETCYYPPSDEDEKDRPVPDDQDRDDEAPGDDDDDGKPNEGDHDFSGDSDGDGMPDDWETAMGLDPAVDDSQADMDGDRISNLDEYLNGSDPAVPADNVPPQAPHGQWPVDGVIVNSLIPELIAEAFYDADDPLKAHLKSRWRIIRSYDNVTVFDARSQHYLTEFQVPNWVLEPETEYFWQVQFYDKLGAASQWSAHSEFKTPIDVDDRDGDGVPDYQEADEDQDLNQDGIPDSMQPDTLKCVTGYHQNGIVGIGISGVQGNNLISGASNGDIADYIHSLSDTSSLPYGLFEYKIEVTEPGSTIQVKIFLPEPAAETAQWYQLDIENNWTDLTEYSQFSSDRKTITLELKDGGYGDIDGTENSVIVDRSGLILTPQSSGDSSLLSSPFDWGGTGACFVNSLRKTNDIERFYLWLAGAGIAMMLLGKLAQFWRGKLPRAK